jgi:hypothetical protein
LTSAIKLLLIFLAGHAVMVSCNNSRKTGSSIPDQLLKDTVLIDTTFIFEASGGFYSKEDVIYPGPVALIKPAFKLTERNYYSYKHSTINFLFGGGSPEYGVLKAKYVSNSYNDSLEYKLTEKIPAKEIALNDKCKLLERKIKMKCFKIGSKNDQYVIDPFRNKPVKTKTVTYYGVYAIEY